MRGWRLGTLAIAWLSSCAIDLSGTGDPTPAPPEPDASGPTPEGDGGTSSADATEEPARVFVEELIEEKYDDASLVDDALSPGVVVAGGTASLGLGVTLGSGADGTCFVGGFIDLGASSCVGRAFPDAPSALLSQDAAAKATSLTLTTPLAGLAAGDRLLVIDMQGAGALGTTGRTDEVLVQAVSGNTVTLATPLAAAHTVVARALVQRIPQYQTLTVAPGGQLVAGTWDGNRGGLVVVRVRDAAQISGVVTATGTGYRGGPAPGTSTSADGFSGESALGGYNAYRSRNAFGGGGGGGRGDSPCANYGTGGAGGGHGTAGAQGTNTACGGVGGGAYGAVDLLTLGSGGGSGGNDNTLGNNPIGGAGGRGGGAVWLEADTLTLSGAAAVVSASGAAGQGDLVPCGGTSNSTTSCWDFSGPGGGGAGGTVWLRARSATLGADLVRATGGAAGLGVNNHGGAGGVGRVVVAASTVSGSTQPTYAPRDVVARRATIRSRDLLAGRAPVDAILRLSVELAERPAGTTVKAELSTDGAAWYAAMPPNATTLEVGVATVAVSMPPGPHLYVRFLVETDGHVAPVLDRYEVVVGR